MPPLVSFVVLSACIAVLIGCSSSTQPATVTPSVTVSANAQNVDQGESINVTATVANDSGNKGVQWTLQCTTSNCGTLSNQTSTSATYTAPATVLSNISGTLMATSIANSAAVASTQLTAVPLPTIPLGTGSPNGSGAPTGAQGAPYTYTLQNSGGVAPYTWSVATGSLPVGLALGTSSGTLSGTPTVAGTFNATMMVTDSGTPAKTATAALTFAITPAAAPLSITTTSLPTAIQNTAASTTFAATGGAGAYKWSIATGSFPAGMTLSQAGVLSGTPTVTGSFPFTVAVQDSATSPASSSTSFTLTVNPPNALAITTTSLADGAMGSPYNVALQATGGKASYKWSLASGTLPPGMNFVTGVLPQPGVASFTGGTLYGTPSANGTYTFSIAVTDSTTPTAQTATQSFSLKIAALSGTNNSWLNGHYAFYMVGFTDPDSCTPISSPIADQPMTMTGSFVADGSGHITQGQYDSYFCGQSTTQHSFTGTYSVGADQRGRLVMSNVINGQSTFAFSVEQIQGGVAQQAQFIEFDDTSQDQYGSRGSGVMQLQTPSAFTTSSLNGNYVYGLTGPGPSVGLLTFNGSGTISGPSVTGAYGTPDALSGRTTLNINSTNYVMYMVNAQQAFLAANGTALATASIAAGQMRQQQSNTFTNASWNGALVGYGVTPIPTNGTSYVGGVKLYSATADGTGNLTGTLDVASHYGPTPFSTTYSVSSNGLTLLGTGDAVWLYGPNAGFGVSSGGLINYETAAGGPFTLDVTTGPYSVGTLPPTAGNAVLDSGSYIYIGSGNATASLDYSTYLSSLSLTPGTSTNISTVVTTALPVCTPGCFTPVALSATRAIAIQGTGSANTVPSPVILIFQK